VCARRCICGCGVEVPAYVALRNSMWSASSLVSQPRRSLAIEEHSRSGACSKSCGVNGSGQAEGNGCGSHWGQGTARGTSGHFWALPLRRVTQTRPSLG
jgi:hypothetical protein